MNPDLRGAGKNPGPAGADSFGVVIGSALGQRRSLPVKNGAGDLTDLRIGAGLRDHLGVSIAGICKLALVLLAGSLIDHVAQRTGKLPRFYTVQDDFGDGKLTLYGLATGFEIQSLR